jgi:AraC family transcriptional regulator of adaptative response/methylated-DNA-[protein]-cysteine methyltransferase
MRFLEPMNTNGAPSADLGVLDRDYQRVEKAILYLSENFTDQPSLDDVAREVGLSEFHFQRLFGRWVGISPKRFLQVLTKEHAKRLLAHSRSVLDTAYDSGLSSPSRLHDLLLATEAVTPGQYQNRGEDLDILFGFHASPFGRCLVATTDRGVCALRFLHVPGRSGSESESCDWLAHAWPCARLGRDQDRTAAIVAAIFSPAAGAPRAPLHVHVRGTNFQIKVWEALLAIPPGLVLTYGDIARRIGAPGASRAVGNAVGDNPVPFLIPCHRVILSGGEFGNYGEGPARKKAILGWEAARNAAPAALAV